MKGCLFFYAAVTALMLPASIVFNAPGHVYTDMETPTACGGVPGTTYRLSDWRGRPVGISAVWDADGSAILPKLPTGYYHLNSGDMDVTFAVVPEPQRRAFDHDSFYGIDSAQSWISRKGTFVCPWNGGDTYRTVSDLLWRSGLPHVRERMRWGEVNPRPDSIDYGCYMHNADLLHARGMLISGMFHDAPQWAGVLKKLPSDLNAVHEFCAHAAVAFGNRMGDWEFWNEEDIGYAPEPVWDYAAAMKAAYLGFKMGRPEVTVLPGALCQLPDSPYARALFDNDIAKFCDAYNLHVYFPIADYPRHFATLRSFMERYGMGGRAVWITESGTHQEGLSEKDGVMKGRKANTPEQELVVAEYYAKSQIAFQMEGVSRNYYFVFGAYNDACGAKDWGVMRRDGTVKPIYAVICTMMHELVSARLVGEMDVGEKLRAYLFEQQDGSQTVVYWSVSPMDMCGGHVVATPDYARRLDLHVASGTYRLSDFCGACSSATVTNGVLALDAVRFPAYVSGLHGLTVAKYSRSRGTVIPYVPTAEEDMTVIIRVDLNTSDFEIAGQKTRTVLKNDTGRLRVQVWNMDAAAKTGCVEVAGGSFEGLPDTIVLGPRGTPPAEFFCKFVPPKSDEVEQRLVLTGAFNGKHSSRLVLPVHFEKRFFASCIRTPIDWNELKNWQHNTSANSYSIAWDEAEQAIRFDVSWNDNKTDRWLYPVYRLRLPQENLSGANMIQFEVKSAQDKAENDFNAQNLIPIFDDNTKTERYIPYLAPLGSWETRYVELSDIDSLADVTAFRIGANPKGSQCTFWIRNLAILRKKEKKDE